MTLEELAEQWQTALDAWAIPEEILANAPISPWVHPPNLFRVSDDVDVPDTASFREARAALGAGGTMVDVGCGGGRSSLPLGSLVSHVTGVDESDVMLDQFMEAARVRGIPADTVQGRWPEVAPLVDTADVVVCHHVVYNVADIVRFVDALTQHARRRVVVELTARHPLSALNPLWKRFWGLERPTEPSADLFADIVRSMGIDPTVSSGVRAPRRSALVDRREMVAFVRQRLCLTEDRDDDIEEVLGNDPALSVDEFVTVAWAPQ
jgi:SAM-dependent methyltransferase